MLTFNTAFLNRSLAKECIGDWHITDGGFHLTDRAAKEKVTTATRMKGYPGLVKIIFSCAASLA